MINAGVARSYAFENVNIKHYAEAMNNLYDGIDNIIKSEAKKGKMFANFCIKRMADTHIKVSLSEGQLRMLADIVKTKYEQNGFKVKIDSYSYTFDNMLIEIGWF